MDGQNSIPRRTRRRLPTDAQASILSFLELRDLVHFSKASLASHRTASLGILWRPWLEAYFAHIKSWAAWGSTPQFASLALAVCMVCAKPLLRLEPRTSRDSEATRYPGPHSCDSCQQLCCEEHHCQCTCMAEESCLYRDVEYDFDFQGQRRPHICIRCEGWGHEECDMMQGYCVDCKNSFCYDCESMSERDNCLDLFCIPCLAAHKGEVWEQCVLCLI